MTLEKNVSNGEDMDRYILQLSEMVGRRLRRGHYSGRTIALTLRYSDFHTFTRRCTIKEYINDGFDIYLAALDILRVIRLKVCGTITGCKYLKSGNELLPDTTFQEGQGQGSYRAGYG